MGWSDDLNKIIKRDEANAEKWLRAAVIQAANVAIVRSPVGNPDLWVWNHPDLGYVDYVAWKGYPEGYAGGQYRSNHRLSINAVDYGIRDIAGVSEVLNDIVNGSVKFELGDTMYVTNPLPYAARIEYDSWSSQAPDGVYRPAILALKKALSKKAS